MFVRQLFEIENFIVIGCITLYSLRFGERLAKGLQKIEFPIVVLS